MTENNAILGRAAGYQKLSLWVNAGLTLLLLFILQLRGFHYAEVKSITVAAIYTLVVSTITGITWRGMARKSEQGLTWFYLGASVAKLFLAVLMMVVLSIVSRGDRQQTIAYIAGFAIYFFVFLISDSLCFFLAEKGRSKNK